jgi:hypothetical protein
LKYDKSSPRLIYPLSLNPLASSAKFETSRASPAPTWYSATLNPLASSAKFETCETPHAPPWL